MRDEEPPGGAATLVDEVEHLLERLLLHPVSTHSTPLVRRIPSGML